MRREPSLRLDVGPVFRVAIQERRPRYLDLTSEQFKLPWWEPRSSTTLWHDEYLAMVTPPEYRLYSQVFTNGELLQLAATSLAFAGAMSLIKAGIGEIAEARREGQVRDARREVDEALRAFEEARRAAERTGPPPGDSADSPPK